MAECQANLGWWAGERGDLEMAEHHLARGLAIREQPLGRDHGRVADLLLELGLARERHGDPAMAVEPLERALAIYVADEDSARDRASAEFVLARASWRSQPKGVQARKRAIKLAKAAAGEERARDRVEIEAWLAECGH